MYSQSTTTAIIHQTGDPSVFSIEQKPLGEPAPHEVLIKHTAIGVNFIDTYFRSGLYPIELPVSYYNFYVFLLLCAKFFFHNQGIYNLLFLKDAFVNNI